MAPGRPPSDAGRKRKARMVAAWEVASSLSAADLAEAAGIRPTRKFYSVVHRGSAHQPTGKALVALAIAFEDLAPRLLAEAKMLRDVAAETEGEGTPADSRRPAKGKKPRRASPGR
jgi:hypothetical protein